MALKLIYSKKTIICILNLVEILKHQGDNGGALYVKYALFHGLAVNSARYNHYHDMYSCCYEIVKHL